MDDTTRQGDAKPVGLTEVQKVYSVAHRLPLSVKAKGKGGQLDCAEGRTDDVKKNRRGGPSSKEIAPHRTVLCTVLGTDRHRPTHREYPFFSYFSPLSLFLSLSSFPVLC